MSGLRATDEADANSNEPGDEGFEGDEKAERAARARNWSSIILSGATTPQTPGPGG